MRIIGRRYGLAAVMGFVLAAVGCGDSSSSGGGGSGGEGAAGGVEEGAGGSGTGGNGAGGGPAAEYAAMVRGRLASGDLAEAQATHDAIASAGEAQSKAAGDFAHDVLLGTTILDSVENEFFAFDRWTDADAMQAFYADPEVQAAFGSLFAEPPSLEFFVYQPTWENWGDMESGDAFDPYYFHLALGTLAQEDTEANHGAHDQVAAGGKEPSIGAGNVAHLVFLGLEDERRFVAVDIWQSDDNMEAFYSNPDFVAAFAPLFESVSQPVYVSTDWHQW